MEEHLTRLDTILCRLESAGLKIRPDKCMMLQREVLFLGHVISGEGIKTSASKTDAVTSWPVPTSIKDVRSFLGLCSYYRKFIKNFAGIASPLHALTGKYARFEWDGKCQKAFEEMKEKLVTAPVMAFPRDEGQYILDCDASQVAIGAVLSQMQDGEEKVIAYASRLYSKAERNYCVTRRELLAVVYFCKHFRQYLLGRSFLIRTDHSALTWLRRTPDPVGQQSRWLEQLEEYSFVVQHRSGKKHENADAMSRIPCKQCHRIDDNMDVVENHVNVVINGQNLENEWSKASLEQLQMEDPQIEEFHALKLKYQDTKPDVKDIIGCSEDTKILWYQWGDIVLQEGVLHRKHLGKDMRTIDTQLVVPKAIRKHAITLAHTGMTGGHLGPEKTKLQVRRRMYWPGWAKEVESFCKFCEACAGYRRGPAPKQGYLDPMVMGAPMERVSVDITGPHPISSGGHKYILTIVDHFSKWADAFPIRNQEAHTIAKILVDRVFCYVGMPLQLLSDQGKNFESELFKELCQSLGIEKLRTSIYKPSTNGAVERFHRTLNSMIGKVICENHRNWHTLLPQILAAYRASEHSATGYSPNKIMLGRENRAPIDLVLGAQSLESMQFSHVAYVEQMQKDMLYSYAEVRKTLGKAAQRRKFTYDLSVKPKHFKIGDRVLYLYPRRYRSRSPKWQRNYIGPYEVIKQISPLNYVLKRCKGKQEVLAHVDKMKLWFEEPQNGGPNDQKEEEVHEQVGGMEGDIYKTLPKRCIRRPKRYDEYVVNCICRPKHQKSRGGRWTSPTARGCNYCTVWTRNKKEMTAHVKKAHDDVLKSRRMEHERREKIEEKERLLIEIRQRWRGDNLQVNVASVAEREMPSERSMATIVEREMPSEDWEEPEVQLEFPQQEAARPPVIRSAEAERLIQIGERERRDAAVMQEEANVRSSLDERIEKMKEGSEGETSLALVLEGVKDREARKGSEPLLEKAATVASTTEGEGHRKSNASVPRRNVRVQTEADISTALLDISEERMIAAADVILAITVAHPTWPEEVILKLAREKRSIRELPDKLIRLLVYTTCMTKIQLQLEREAVEEEEQKKAMRGENKGGEKSMEKEDAESRSRKEEVQGEGCQME